MVQQPPVDNVFSANRAEELGYDVWPYFVLPFFFSSLDLENAKKARVIIGGRGCGKTMLLRYLSHSSQFSPHRVFRNTHLPQNIGLYWRIDTQFANTMRERGVTDETWDAAFQHATALNIGRSILQSLRSISKSQCGMILPSQLELLDFSQLAAFDPLLPAGVDELTLKLRQYSWALQTWTNHPRAMETPLFLPGPVFVRAIISLVQEQVHALASSSFCVYVDEYENLLEYQQRIINTYLKHGEPPLLFHVAMKRNGMRTRQTQGGQEITNIADYRDIDLDKCLHEHSFDIFAAEILFLRLSRAGYDLPFLDVSCLQDPARIDERKNRQYHDRLLAAARQMLPGLSDDQLAGTVFADDQIFGHLRDSLDLALRRSGSKLDASCFLLETQKKASIVCPCIISRRRNRPEVILEEIKKLERGETNRFTGSTNWIHNNFIGQVLLLYSGKHRTCPVYAGFDSFIYLARGNLRHFLELCYTSMKRAQPNNGLVPISIPIEQQAAAAKEASAALLKEVRGFGRQGNKLHTFTLALGSLFALAHSRPTQSEPEISHFSIGGNTPINPSNQEILNEAVKWSVLFEEEETKKKESFQVERSQWVLNPIYAPYFGITYRKKRKLEISAHDLHILIEGTYETKRKLLNKYLESWEISSASLNLSLFSHLD